MSQRVKVAFGAFGQKLGFQEENKAPQRRDLITLLGKVSAYQPSEAAAKLTETLNLAITKLDGQGPAKALVKDANNTIAEVKLAVEQLKKEKEEQKKLEKSQQPSKKELKAMKTLQKELENELDKVVKTIDPGLGTIRLEGDHSKTGLLAAAETIRREIYAGDPGEGDREDKLRAEINGLEIRVSKANLAHSKEAAFMVGVAPGKVDAGELLLTNFHKQVGGTYQGPLLRTMEVLRSQMSSSPSDPTTVRTLLAQVDQVRKDARTKSGFVKDSHDAGVAAHNGEVLGGKLEDMLKPLQDSLTFLREAEAPGYDKIASTLADLRKKAGAPIPNDAVAESTKAVISEVEKLAQEIQREREGLDDLITQAGLAAQEALAEAKQLFGTQQNTHKDAKALEADFKAIEALIGSAEDRVPATGALPKGLTVKDVQLAQSLAEQAAARLKDIKDNTGALLTFDQETKAMAKELETRSFFQKLKGNERGALEKYDPKAREAAEKKLNALLAGLPTTPAKTSVETLHKLKDELQKTVDDMAPTVKYLEETAEPLLNKMEGWELLLLGGGSGLTRLPKAFDEAMKALKAQVKLQPPVLEALKAAVEAAEKAFKEAEAMDTDQLFDVTGKEAAEDRKVEKQNSKRRSEEEKLLYRLEVKYEAAKEAVDEVDGDKNSLKAADRLIEQIKADIKANQFDKIENKRNDLDARLTLLLSNPRGEANRRRSELPGVIAELRGAINGAVTNLKGVADEVGKYQPTDDDETEAQQITVALLEAYVELLESEIGDMERVSKPIMDTSKASEDERRKAREEGLRILRSFRKRLQVQPMTSELLKAPFPPAKAAIAPVFRGLEKFEYTLTTCI